MEEQKLSMQQTDSLPYKNEVNEIRSKASVQENLRRLADYGGMRFLRNIVKNIELLDTQRMAARNVFLEDPMYLDTRKKLRNELLLWMDILKNEDSDVRTLLKYCNEEIIELQERKKNNLYTIREETKELERTYRTLNSFFLNTNNPGQPVRCLTLININRKNISKTDSEDGKVIKKEIVREYDKLDLKDSYSLLVIPDFFHLPKDLELDGKNVTASDLRDWAKIAHDNKCLLLTDFEDSFSYEDLCSRLDHMSLQDSDLSASNVVLTCNHLLARRKSELSDEPEDFYIPASAALAGRMTDTENIVISQGVAGQRFGGIERALGVRFELLKSEIAALIDKGVVPMIEFDGRVIAFSDNTLYNGKNQWLQEYPIVRVFDWVNKVIQHFCNSEALIVWDTNVRSEMESVLTSFLEQYKGHGKLYEDYILKQIVQDSDTKNIHVQIEIRPFYATKNFLIELTGKNMKTTVEWKQNVTYLDK